MAAWRCRHRRTATARRRRSPAHDDAPTARASEGGMHDEAGADQRPEQGHGEAAGSDDAEAGRHVERLGRDVPSDSRRRSPSRPQGLGQVARLGALRRNGDIVGWESRRAGEGRRRVVAPFACSTFACPQRSSRASHSEGDPSGSASDEATNSAYRRKKSRAEGAGEGSGPASVGSGGVGTPPRSLGASAGPGQRGQEPLASARRSPGASCCTVQDHERPCRPSAHACDDGVAVPHSLRRRARGSASMRSSDVCASLSVAAPTSRRAEHHPPVTHWRACELRVDGRLGVTTTAQTLASSAGRGAAAAREGRTERRDERRSLPAEERIAETAAAAPRSRCHRSARMTKAA